MAFTRREATQWLGVRDSIIRAKFALGPALAGPGIIGLPEPATLTLFGLGVAGAYVAKRCINRK